MANQKTALYKVLVVALVFLCWFQSSGRVEAEELSHRVYEVIHTERNKSISHRIYSYDDTNGYDIYSFCYSEGTKYRNVVLYGYKQLSFKINELTYYELTDGTINVTVDNESNNINTKYTLSDGTVVYVYGMYRDYLNSNYEPRENIYCHYYDFGLTNDQVETALERVIVQNTEPDIPYYGDYTPDWSASEYDQLLKIENLQASIEDDILYMTWDPVIYPCGDREFHYIKFNFKQRHPGAVEGGNRRNFVEKQFYIQYKTLCGQIPIADLELDEGYILSSMTAVPYYHLSDNPEFPLKHGDTTYVYFDDDGVSSNPIIIDPAVDPDVEEEEVPRTILGTIQNFFSNFWRNITNTAKNAVVPDQDELLGLLGEMNDWFSERFGFIWYPFDLAVDIVGAFALGEPDTQITVPALTLNMMGGIKLWDSFVIDLDPVDFLKYVRFFTSVLMCCGTVSLAIRKWEEWIGGKNQ